MSITSPKIAIKSTKAYHDLKAEKLDMIVAGKYTTEMLQDKLAGFMAYEELNRQRSNVKYMKRKEQKPISRERNSRIDELPSDVIYEILNTYKLVRSYKKTAEVTGLTAYKVREVVKRYSVNNFQINYPLSEIPQIPPISRPPK